MAVFLGRTAQVASCGLLKASTYRLVSPMPHASVIPFGFQSCCRVDVLKLTPPLLSRHVCRLATLVETGRGCAEPHTWQLQPGQRCLTGMHILGARWASCRRALGTRTWSSTCARGRTPTWTCQSSSRLPATTCQNGALPAARCMSLPFSPAQHLPVSRTPDKLLTSCTIR